MLDYDDDEDDKIIQTNMMSEEK
jgi:hypothetical protein